MQNPLHKASKTAKMQDFVFFILPRTAVHKILVLASIIGWSSSSSAEASQVPVLSFKDTDTLCDACEVRLIPVVTLGEDSGPGAIGGLSTIAQMPDGRYVTSSDAASAELVVFAADGQFLRRVGRRGPGPGEFQWIRWIRATDDGRLHVFDPRQRRQSVLSSDFHLVRTNPFPGNPILDVEVLSDSLTVINSLILTPDRVGFVLHAYSPEGNVRSFAAAPGGFRSDLSGFLYARSLASTQSDYLWAAHWSKYQLKKWDIDGSLLQVILRHTSWFPNHLAEISPPKPNDPPLPTIMDIREDDRGRVWVLVRVPEKTWSDAVLPRKSAIEGSRFMIGDINRAYDTIIEVFDVLGRAFLVSTRLDPALIEFIGEDKVVSYSEEAPGIPRIRVWETRIHESTSRR